MSGRDVGASVRQRLLNQSRAQGRPFQELLQYFAMERFLYRLAKSPFSDRFVLKGALLLTAWRAPFSRPTMDIDLAGRTTNDLDHIADLVSAVCGVAAEPDGIEFNRASIEVSRIKEDADYEGVRVKLHAVLAKARYVKLNDRPRPTVGSDKRLVKTRPDVPIKAGFAIAQDGAAGIARAMANGVIQPRLIACRDQDFRVQTAEGLGVSVFDEGGHGG